MDFGGDNPSLKEWLDNYKYFKHRPTRVKAIQVKAGFEVETLKGIVKGKPFDYLVQGSRCEFYPVDKDIFESIYESE